MKAKTHTNTNKQWTTWNKWKLKSWTSPTKIAFKVTSAVKESRNIKKNLIQFEKKWELYNRPTIEKLFPREAPMIKNLLISNIELITNFLDKSNNLRMQSRLGMRVRIWLMILKLILEDRLINYKIRLWKDCMIFKNKLPSPENYWLRLKDKDRRISMFFGQYMAFLVF